MTTEMRDARDLQDRFLARVVAQHRTGDHYPDPQVIGASLRFSPAQTEAVLRQLRTLGWVAASPYNPDYIRLTPRCWNALAADLVNAHAA